VSDWGGRVLSILSPWHMLGVLPAFGYLGEVVGGRWCKLRLHPYGPATGCREGRSQLCSLLYRRPRVLPPSYGSLTRYEGVFSSQAAFSQLMTCRFERTPWFGGLSPDPLWRVQHKNRTKTAFDHYLITHVTPPPSRCRTLPPYDGAYGVRIP
jgi:hypothetical protein